MNLISEDVSSLLLSLGGSAAILLTFAKTLEKLLIDQVSKRTTARLNQDLETLKSEHNRALEEFKAKSTASIKEREIFSTISIDVYQDFFKNRITTYKSLLDWKNECTKDMLEDFTLEYTERFGDKYFFCYRRLREILIPNQMYISNDLDQKFQKLRHAAAKHINNAEYYECMASSEGVEPQDYMQKVSEIYDHFSSETFEIMNDINKQIDIDISKIRSRIEIDKA